VALLKNPFAKKSGGQSSAPPPRPVMAPAAGSTWIVQMEHWDLRFVSFVVALGSAFAIQQVESLLGNVGPLETAAGWMFAFSAGVLGYFLSRALAYRLMQKEAIWLYLPLCLLVEFVEVVCNYIVAVRAIHGADWVKDLPSDQRGTIVLLLYGVLSVIPLFTIFLAVADMDLERKKGHMLSARGMPQPPSQWSGATAAPKSNQSLGGAGGQQQYQPMGTQRNVVRLAAPPQRPPAQPTVRQFNGVHPSEDVTVP